jgi:hypothetical protein
VAAEHQQGEAQQTAQVVHAGSRREKSSR